MSSFQEEFDLISQYLFSDNKPITYKVLSRSFKLSNSTAKDVLKKYYEKFHKDKQDINPTYVLTGISEGGNLIKLSKLESLEQDKKIFDCLNSCSVYALNSNSSLSFNNIVAVNLSLKSEYTENNCDVWGVLRTKTATSISEKDIEIKSESTQLDQQQQQQQQAETNEPAPRPSGRKSATEPVNPTTTKTKLESSGVSSLYISRKTSSKPKSSINNSNNKKEEPSRSLYTSRKNEAKNKVVIDDFNDDKDDIEEARPVKRTKVETIKEKQQKKAAAEEKMKNFFNDDDFDDIGFSDEDDSNMSKVDSIDVSKEEKEEKEVNKDLEKSAGSKSVNKSTSKTSNKQPSNSIEKFTAKIDKSKSPTVDSESENKDFQSTQEFIKTVDENGFTVITKSKNYVAPEAKRNTDTPKGHTISSIKKNTASSKGTNSSKKQSSLMSFFNAKKK